VHLAAGKDWRDHRIKAPAGVIYLALERGRLVKRRLEAYKKRDGLRDLPIAVADELIDLMSRDCVDIVAATIWDAEQKWQLGAGLVIIDSYSKGIAAGGGDEDKARDQNAVVANLRRLQERFDIHIACVGHMGKNTNRGERGSNAKLAHVDLEIQFSGDEVKTATITKANDEAKGVLTHFQLEPVEFARDEDGDPNTTWIVSPEAFERGTNRQRLSNNQKLAMRALAEAVLSHGINPPPQFELPHSITKVVRIEHWKTELERQNVIDPGSSNPYQQFKRLREALKTRFLIGERDAFVWLARPAWGSTNIPNSPSRERGS
jgi:hypothetical protein